MLNKLTSTFLLVLLLAPLTWATTNTDSATPKPYKLVEDVTEGILTVIAAHKEQFETDPQPFYNDLTTVMEDAVDFPFIAKNVMGPYGKTATVEQRQRFEKAFKADLIKTYARGLFTYGNQEIVVIPSDEDISGKRRVTVYQEIRSEGKTYPLNYSLGLNKQGQWKVTNLVINGINLGKTFRNQFIQRSKEFDGNIDSVIDNWTFEANKENT